MHSIKRLTALSIVLVASSLSAQESTGTIVGIVRDTSGRPLKQITVFAEGVGVLGSRTVRTDDKGEFRLPLLLPGNYIVKAYGDDYLGQQATTALAAGQILRHEFTLKAKAAGPSAVVEIIADSAAVDKSTTTTSTSFTMDKLESLPISSRNAIGAEKLAPGVVGSTAPIIRGGMLGSAQGTLNGIYIRDNGANINQTDVLLDDLVEDVAVIQSPLNAKYGNTAAGLVAVTTKTGTNEFQGTFRAKLSRGTWQGLSNDAANRFGSEITGSGALSAYAVQPTTVNGYTDTLTKSFEISISGPIIKDRVTFLYGTRIAPDSYSTSSYTNLLNSTSSSSWKTYIPGVSGITNSSTAGYTWGISTATPTVTPTSTSTTHTDFNQYELYFQLSQSQQLKVGYSRQAATVKGLGTGTPDTTINAGGSESLVTLKTANYRSILLNGSGILDLKWGKRETKSTNKAVGPGDPVYVRAYTSTATSIFNTGSTQASSYVTNGFAGTSSPTRNGLETYSGDLQYFIGIHQINVGFELLKDTQRQAWGTGPNNRTFYTMGRLSDGNYLVYNYVGSLPSTDLSTTTAINPNTGKAVTQAQLSTWLNTAGYIPQMATVESSPGDLTVLEQTRSYYLNDLMEIGKNWTFLAGLRLDAWKVKDRSGVRINSAAYSPRGEIKWDPMGNSRHLFSFSIADMRGTFQDYIIGSYLRKGGNITRRYFWNQGTTTPYGVSLAAVTNPDNYGYYYYYSNSDQLSDIDSTIKPDRTRQFELKYMRSFESGATFRTSLVFRKSYDMLTARGYDKAVIMKDPDGSPVKTSAGVYSYLTRDPYGKREYTGLETEWSVPIIRSANLGLNWGGNYTFNRRLATNDLSEGNSNIVYYDVLAAQNIPLNAVNPYGERQNTVKHSIRSWITLELGGPKEIHHTFSLLGTYTSGQAISNYVAYYYPANSFPNLQAAAAAGYTVSYPTTFYTYPQGRGNRRDIDSYSFDLKWNMVIPVRRSLSFLVETMVTNVFNIQKPVYDVGNNTGSWGYPSTTATWNPAGGNDTSIHFSPYASTLYTYGSASYFTPNPRTFTLELGLRF